MDDALTECPACRGTLRKVFGNIGIAFKGSGFYRTDNRSDGHKAKASSGTSRDGSSTTEAKGTKGDGGGSASKSESPTSSSSAGNGSSSTKAAVAAAS
jgi:predicted nucleic acid-binding Zn ribbon protein